MEGAGRLILIHITMLMSFYMLGHIHVSASGLPGRTVSFLDSPVAPRVADCRVAKALIKRTKKRYLVCSMFKDEQGYLAEFLGYYRAHGFDHAILWDHGSSDGFMEELAPWLADGFAEVRSLTSLEHLPSIQSTKRFRKKSGSAYTYHRVMAQKKEVERQCFRWGFAASYDYYLTADLDEYVVPLYNPVNTLVRELGLGTSVHGQPYVALTDVIDEIFSIPVAQRVAGWRAGNVNSSRPLQYASIVLSKVNFNANPHVLAPLDLLQIEAYQARVADAGRMSFYTRVLPKVVYRLSGIDITGGPREYSNGTHTLAQEVLASCCFFHGCNGALPGAKPATICSNYRSFFKHSPEALWPQDSGPSRYWLRMNHYARSLEKFTLKQLTWETANQESNSYDLSEYMTRTFGWMHDPTGAQFGCAVRRTIRETHRRFYGTALAPRFGDGNAGVDTFESDAIVRSGLGWRRRQEWSVLITGAKSIINTTAVPPNNPTMYEFMRRKDAFVETFLFDDYYESNGG